MAKLNAAARRKLPSRVFAGPGRSFPIPDKGHAKAALGRINNAPPSARPKIRRMAEAKLKGNAKGGKMKARMSPMLGVQGAMQGAMPQQPFAKGGSAKVAKRSAAKRTPARRKK